MIRRFHGRNHRLMQQIRYPIFSLCDFQRTGAHNRSFLRDEFAFVSSDDVYSVTIFSIHWRTSDHIGFDVTPELLMVEVNGVEPMTSCVQGRRSPN